MNDVSVDGELQRGHYHHLADRFLLISTAGKDSPCQCRRTALTPELRRGCLKPTRIVRAGRRCRQICAGWAWATDQHTGAKRELRPFTGHNIPWLEHMIRVKTAISLNGTKREAGTGRFTSKRHFPLAGPRSTDDSELRGSGGAPGRTRHLDLCLDFSRNDRISFQIIARHRGWHGARVFETGRDIAAPPSARHGPGVDDRRVSPVVPTFLLTNAFCG